MSWFRPSHASQCQIERLEEAERGLLASQADLHAEAEATTGTVVAVREREEALRVELQEKAKQVEEQPLHTSDMLRNVEEMLADLRTSGDHRTRRH